MNSNYKSPFSDRYGGSLLQECWSSWYRRAEMWRIWTDYLELLIDEEVIEVPDSDRQQLERLTPNVGKMQVVEREVALAESELHHDLLAELRIYTRHLPPALKRYAHLGLTSSDVVEEVDHICTLRSLQHLNNALQPLIAGLSARVQETAEVVVLGRTHLQPADPTTLGYRLAPALEQLVSIKGRLNGAVVHWQMQGRGLRGAVGTSAFAVQLRGDEMWLARRLATGHTNSRNPSLTSVSQTRPRNIDLNWASILCDLAAVMSKLALDLRLMSMSGLFHEAKTGSQIGSSAMPTKSNPITLEKVGGLSRHLLSLYSELWQAASMQMLERTLDDSSTRRYALAEFMLTAGEVIDSMHRVLTQKWTINEQAATVEFYREWRSWASSFALTEVMWKGTVQTHETREGVSRFIADAASKSQDIREFCTLVGEKYGLMHSLSPEVLVGKVNSNLALCVNQAQAVARKGSEG